MSSEKTITFYDIPSTLDSKAWSPNTFMTRYILNFKGLKYKTEWVEYPDIEAKSKEIGAKPTGERNGKPLYTLPAIKDVDGTAISDTIDIALYLDKTYPDTPAAFPKGTVVFHAAFQQLFGSSLGSIVHLLFPGTAANLNPRSEEYFRSSREAMFGGVKLEDFAPAGSEKRAAYWKSLNEGWDTIAGLFSRQKEQYIMGDTPVFADFLILTRLEWMKLTLGEESEEWKAFIGRNDGRWSALMKSLDKYTAIN